jgi:very-short-patch-repair endonuclease
MSWDLESIKRRGLITTGFHLPYNPELVDVARKLRKESTAAEKKLWDGLLKNFKFRVLRQRPIDHFIVDFYCPKMKLVIEVDGAAHYSKEGKEADRERSRVLEAYGLQVIRFSDHEVINHFSRVCTKIQEISSRKQ